MAVPAHPYFTETPQGLHYDEVRVFSVAALLLLFCLFFLGFGVAVLVEVASWPWHMGRAIAILTAVACLAFGLVAGLFCLAAIQPQHLVFDAKDGRLHGRARGRFWLMSSVDIAFAQLQRPQIIRTEHESDGDTFDIRIGRDGASGLRLGSYASRAEAEHWQARIAAMMT